MNRSCPILVINLHCISFETGCNYVAYVEWNSLFRRDWLTILLSQPFKCGSIPCHLTYNFYCLLSELSRFPPTRDFREVKFQFKKSDYVIWWFRSELLSVKYKEGNLCFSGAHAIEVHTLCGGLSLTHSWYTEEEGRGWRVGTTGTSGKLKANGKQKAEKINDCLFTTANPLKWLLW